jgi:predicted PurR-regulated permease PerM
MKISKRIILIIYVILLLVGLILILTGYSFSFHPLNILLFLAIISYPIVRFIRSSIYFWIKLILGLLLIITAILFGNSILYVLAFKESTIRNVQNWDIGNYQISLNEKQGWAGPPYLQYDLKRYHFFRLINKKIASGQSSENSIDPCKINFSKDLYSTKYIFQFDKCDLVLEKAPNI